MTDPKQGFDLAFASIRKAAGFEVAEAHLGNAIEDLSASMCRHRQPDAARRARDIDAVLRGTETQSGRRHRASSITAPMGALVVKRPC